MRVEIAGGGITGLALHYFLERQGVDSTVREVANRPGGVVESDCVEGRVIDFGPQRTRLTPAIEDVVDALGIRDRLLRAPDLPLFVYHAGALRRVPRTIRGAITTDLLSWRGKFRALLEPARGLPQAGETVEEYLTRAFGREVARRLGGPLYAGLYASDPDDMPVEHSLATALDRFGVTRSVLKTALRSRLHRRDPPPVVSFEEGMEALPRAIYRRHRDSVRLGDPIVELRPSQDGWRVLSESSDRFADAVVLTTPAYASAEILEGVDGESARALASLTYNPLAVVHLRADTDLDAAGYQVSLDADLVTRGVTYNDSLFGRDGVYTCYLGGATRQAVVEWAPDRLGRKAAREFETVTGCPARVLSVRRFPRAMPAYDTSWDALEAVSTPDGVHLCASYESRAGIPGRIRAAKRLAARLAGESDVDR
ncbi:MAG: protoporphyrinogen oxidase [Halobacteriales archaeon]